MREALEAGWQGEKATERLLAVVSAALRVARAESVHNPDALMFTGVFGLKEEAGLPAVVDLCGLIQALVELRDNSDSRSGLELLTELAMLHGRNYASKYIHEKLTDDHARIVYEYLQRNQGEIPKFLQAIPDDWEYMRNQVALDVTTPFLDPWAAFRDALEGGNIHTQRATAARENDRVESSEALKLARKIWNDCWQAFSNFQARRSADVVDLLERLQGSSDRAANQDAEGQEAHTRTNPTLLDTVREYIYGRTPLKLALTKAKEVFDLFGDDVITQRRAWTRTSYYRDNQGKNH